jgi:hypothetical protein
MYNHIPYAVQTCPRGHHYLAESYYSPATRWEPEDYGIDENAACEVCGGQMDETGEEWWFTALAEAACAAGDRIAFGLYQCFTDRCSKCHHAIDDEDFLYRGEQCGFCQNGLGENE